MAVNNNRQQGSTSLRDAMSELMNDSVIRQATPRERGAGLLLADVIETPEQFVIRVDVPGLNPDDINVSMFQGTVTITCPAAARTSRASTWSANAITARLRGSSPSARQLAATWRQTAKTACSPCACPSRK